MEYYSAIKKNEIVPPAEMWMDRETIIQSKASQRKKNKCINTYRWDLEKWDRWTYLQK